MNRVCFKYEINNNQNGDFVGNGFTFAKQNKSQLSVGELYLPSASGVKLPLGVWGELRK